MRYGSLFSGVGGFDLALDRTGFSCSWQVERDEQCRSILRRHWWEVPKHDDVRTVGRANLAPVDLICGGFPCQDLSVAGRRTGLAGERSGLFYELARIVGELSPAWILLENVPGLLSSNRGRDMGAVLGTLGELGYGYAYRVLDSQYLGVPQRRERVFIVGRAGGVCPSEVLFESEGLPWDSPPSREAGARVAASLTRGAESGGRGGYAGRRQEDDSNIVGALSAQGVGTCGADDNQGQEGHLIANTMQANAGRNQIESTYVAHALTAKGGSGRSDGESETFIAHTLRAEGHDASEDGTGRGTSIIAFNATQTPISGEIAGALSDQGAAVCTSTDSLYTALSALQEMGRSVVGGRTEEEEMHPLRTDGERQGDVRKTLHAGKESRSFGVRRLSPVECERLQNFPDNWTQWGKDERGTVVNLKDSPRYRMLGNAVTVSVVAWIARRIMAQNTP